MSQKRDMGHPGLWHLVGLLFELVGELFDDRVGEHLSRNPLNFGFRCFAGQCAVEVQDEIFALADVFYALVLHLLECAVDGLSLRIEDSALQRNVDIGLHMADYKGTATQSPRN